MQESSALRFAGDSAKKNEPREENMKRVSSITAVTAALIALATPGLAQEGYPAGVVKLVVPAAAGSTTDTLARLVADQLGQRWGKPVIVENVAGGAMNIGAERVARSVPDGYTLLVSPPAPVTFNHMLYRELAYDPRQWVPVALLAKVSNVLVVRRDHPAGSLKELIALAKASPGKVTYASQGVGSTAHLSASQLEMLAGVRMVHVPYRGAVPALNDILAGVVDMFFDTLTTSVPLYHGGRIRLIGVASAERAGAVPEVPTIEEGGLPGFRSITWFALVAPPATPAALAEKINRDVVESLQKPEIAEKLRGLMLETISGTTADAARFIAEEAQLWGKVIKESNVKVQ
jgi:tripartite-type tricarboxylate transporter receptor subunit TctC